MNLKPLLTLIFSALLLAYGIFLLRYLNDAKRCDRQMNVHNRNFRKAAVVITWVHVVLAGLGVLTSLLSLLTGRNVTGATLLNEMSSSSGVSSVNM